MSRPRPTPSSFVGRPASVPRTRAKARPICSASVAVDLLAVEAADVVGLEDLRRNAHVRADPSAAPGVHRGAVRHGSRRATIRAHGQPRGHPVAILCGGRGTRLQEQHARDPQGARRDRRPADRLARDPALRSRRASATSCCSPGYLGEQVEAFVGAEPWPDGVERDVPRHRRRHADGRPGRARRRPRSASGTCCVTYADGVADIDLARAARRARARAGWPATMTVVRPELQFGVAELAADGRVTGFREKPRSRALGQRRLPLPRAGGARADRAGRRARARAARPASRPTASCARTATRASGTAWTPTRTRSCSNDLCERGEAPWRRW